MAVLNNRRRAKGLPEYQYDASLTKVASERANRQARNGRMSHVRGSFSPGRAEGVSYSSRGNPIANACYAMSNRFRKAGASCVKTRKGTYCSLILR